MTAFVIGVSGMLRTHQMAFHEKYPVDFAKIFEAYEEGVL